MTKPIDAAALDQLFREGRTYNAYTDEPLAEADLRAIYDLMKMGPTSANMQPARVVWCLSAEAKERLAALASATNADKIRKAPVTAVLGMDMEFYEKLPKTFPHADARSWFVGNDRLIQEGAFRNSSLQGAYLIMAARALGFGAGPMSGFDNDGVDRAFFAGTPIKSNFICTIGRGDPASYFERLPRLDFDEATRIA